MAYVPAVRFQWDESKNRLNQRRHGVSFEEASKLFSGGQEYLEVFDEGHADQEDRFVAIGPILRGLVLVVYTERDGDVVRIISARWATKRESAMYRSTYGRSNS